MNLNLDFGDLLTRAWRIMWNNKILWVFGFLAGLGGGGSSAPNFNFSGNPGSGRPSGGGPDIDPNAFRRFFDALDPKMILPIIGAMVCGLLVIGVIVFILSTLGEAGLIGGAHLADKNGQVTFGEAWSVGTEKLGRLALLRFLVALPGLVLGLGAFGVGAWVAVMVLRNRNDFPVEGFIPILVCVGALACVFALLFLAIRIVLLFAPFAIVLDDASLGEAASRSWQVLTENLAASIVLGVILVVLHGLFNFALSLPMLVIVVPTLIGIAGIATERQGVGMAALSFALLCCVVYAPIAIVLSSAFQTWITSTWTLAYQVFTRPTVSAPTGAPTPAPSAFIQS